MISSLTLAMLLAAGGDAGRGDARAELDACAGRIEALKAQRQAGELQRRELERLLVRAQELAAELERARQHLPPPPPAPSPEELRERADAARDEADRLAAEIAELDVKIGDARRTQDSAVSRAVLGPAAPSGAASDRLRELSMRRAALAQRRAFAQAAAARYEAEARLAERDR